MTYKLDGWPRKKNRTPLLDYIKLCASFQSHRWIQTCVTYSLETPNSGQNLLFLSSITLKFDGWPWNTIRHLFYATSSFAHHFIAIVQFKLELQSGNTKSGQNQWFFLSCLTLQFDRCPWKTIGYILYGISIFVHHFIAIGQFKLELQSGNAKFGSKSFIFCPVWPWNLMDDLGKQ